MNTEELIEFLEEERMYIGYGEGLDAPTITDEVLADFYETKAEAWFAGWDKCIDAIQQHLHENKRNHHLNTTTGIRDNS